MAYQTLLLTPAAPAFPLLPLQSSLYPNICWRTRQNPDPHPQVPRLDRGRG